MALIVAALVLEASLQVASGDELHDEIHAGLRVVDVEELDNVRVVDALQDLHLARVRVRVRFRVRVGASVRARAKVGIGVGVSGQG